MQSCDATSSSTLKSLGITILRVVIGVIFVVHGYQKFFEFHISGVTDMFTKMNVPMPHFSAIFAATCEFCGGIGLILGLLTRLSALGIACTMIGAWATVHAPHGFSAQNHGYEYVMALLAAAVALMLIGPGPIALDSLLCGCCRKKKPTTTPPAA